MKSSPDMLIRDVSPADLHTITEIDRLCFPPGIAFPEEMFEDCLMDPDCECWGVETEGSIVAFTLVHYAGPRAAQIITIDVHPDHRRQGIAQSLMDKMDKSFRERRIRRVILQVATDNGPARDLYKKWGFTVKTTMPDYYAPGQDAFLMDKTFTTGKAPAHTMS